MTKSAAGPPFPDSPGAWIACFRHRLSDDGRPISPEEFGRRIRRSGATVRRWESNRQIPEERDIARIAEVSRLSPLQVAFLSTACKRMAAAPAPDEREFVCYIRELLCTNPYPAMLLDGLFYVRAWNSYVDALARGTCRAFQQDFHPIALLLRAGPSVLATPEEFQRNLRDGIRVLWLSTAPHTHRPEYASMLHDLESEPLFRELWMELALSRDDPPAGPLSFACSLVGTGARMRAYSRTITFPPTYYLYEYHPDDEGSWERLRRLKERGPAKVFFKSELHWVKQPAECLGETPQPRATADSSSGR